MTTAADILSELKPLGKESYRNTMINHGVTVPILGVKIEDMKKMQKRIKKDYQLALDLFDTGIYDAMYLAGLIADDLKMTKKDLNHWVTSANCKAISEYTVAWVAAEGRFGWELGLKWIESKKEEVATSGWATLSGVIAIKDDADLPLNDIKKLMQRIENSIHNAPNRVRYVMNGFLIAVGSYIPSLTQLAIDTAKRVGPVEVDMGNTACKTPNAIEYIKKVKDRGNLGKKRKSIKC